MNNLNNQVACVALTGGIGSGKSTAAEWLKTSGYAIFNADAIGHELLLEDETKQRIIKEFGDEIVVDNNIDRKRLAQIVFNDSDSLKRLNAILHPAIIERIKKLMKEYKNGEKITDKNIIFFEIPLLFEAGIENLFDMSLNIATSLANRVKRLTKRDRYTEEEVMMRMKNQLPDDIKRKRADFTIDNDNGLDSLYEQLDLLLHQLNSKLSPVTEQ